MTKVIDWKLPIKIIAEGNAKNHWSKYYKLHQEQKARIRVEWLIDSREVTLPCHIVMTRIAPKQLDSDNLYTSLKYVRDAIADCIVPGKRPGMADGTNAMVWHYRQIKGEVKEYALRVEIYCGKDLDKDGL